MPNPGETTGTRVASVPSEASVSSSTDIETPETQEAALRDAEAKRRRRELTAVAIASATLIAFVFAQTQLPPLSSHTSLVSNLVVILLFDLSFLLLGLMLLLVGRNLAKAIFERRRGLIGSKLQARLVFGFIAVALVPSAFLLYVAGVFLHTDVDTWFNPEYEKVLDDSLEIANVYYLNSANNAAHFARVLAQRIVQKDRLKPENRAELRGFLEKAQQEDNLGTLEVFGGDGKLLMLVLSPRTPTGIGVSPDSEMLKRTLKGHAMTRTDRFGKADVIRGSAPIYSSTDSDNVIGAVVVDYYLPKSLAERATGISHSVQEYFHYYGLDQTKLAYAKRDALVMHPGPMNRGVEIDTAVADGAQSLIREQVEMGVAVRMAVLEALSRTLPNA